ncbi:hypothetical protein BAE44_0016805 [Dichanthelium oligosanthes]|uniref:Knottin scorpion toxin-like domain-containing protein n=1 Tax=Dichanthelium oligosanthes TaxID=888268 RepID=A0A1E5VAK2_9POAL|nr:hypothetical protein BAE44_0016805 [Dichanthelium oligosanthes]
MAASALNPFVAVCLLALVVAAGAARTEPEGVDPDMLTTRPCHSNNGWSGHLCRDVCQASGFSRYDFAVANMATGDMARCCCCPKGIDGQTGGLARPGTSPAR